MIGTPAIRNLIREAKVAQMYSAIQTGQQFGMQTLDQNLQDLVKRNVDLGRRGARARRPTRTTFRLSRLERGARHDQAKEQRMERDQAVKFMHDLLRAMVAQEGVGPVHHRRLPAGDQDRRQGDAGVEPAARRRSTRRSSRAR